MNCLFEKLESIERNVKRQKTLTAMCVCEYYIRGDVWIPEVAEHSLLGCVGIKSLELTDLHLCDGQARWGRLQLHTNSETDPGQ